MELKLEEMSKIDGGASWETVVTVGGIITLIIGIISRTESLPAEHRERIAP